MRVMVTGGWEEIRHRIVEALGRASSVEEVWISGEGSRDGRSADVGVVVARWACEGPDLDAVVEGLDRCRAAGVSRLVLVSSAAVQEPSNHFPGMVDEDFLPAPRSGNPVPRAWRGMEDVAARVAREAGRGLTVLRPASTAGDGGPVDRLFARPVAFVPAGFDPMIQLLHPEDLARGVARAVEAVTEEGVFHLAPARPAESIPLSRALREAGVRRVALPYSLLRVVRRLASAFGGRVSRWRLESTRYPWTVCGTRAERGLGFRPRWTSLAAARSMAGPAAPVPAPSPADRPVGEAFDPLGMDRDFIDRLGRPGSGLLAFLHDRWFRMETAGLEHVPREGRVVLVGVHRGFVPLDAMMILHLLARETGRYPRFLVHPGLLKMPFTFDLITRLGGVVASRENAARVLGDEEMAGIFPEGVHGAFRLYRDSYRLGPFMRDEFAKIALAHRAPILPYVTVGSAEAFPILGKIEWRWWRRWSEWPFLPVTPTFPFPGVPIPLPAKFRTRFLPPVRLPEELPAAAVADREAVGEVSARVRAALQGTMDDLLRRRRAIRCGVWRGALFEGPREPS